MSKTHRSFARSLHGIAMGLLAGLGLVGAASHGAQAAQTKSFVVSWLTQAVYSQDGDCPGGLEPTIDEMYTRILIQMGKTPKEAAELMTNFNGGGNYTSPLMQLLAHRGRIGGKPVNVYDNPTSVPDPGVHNVAGKFAPGFNLDGKGAASPNSFEDPETHEKGVNNQYFRAMGCFSTHRAVPPDRPLHWSYSWDSQRDAMRAWIISVTGEDLSKDGDVTVTFNKALEPVMLDVNSNVQRDQTFRIDPDPRTRNVFRGRIKGGLVTVDPAEFHMIGDAFIIPQWDIRNAHVRLTLKPDGTLEGFLGGYQPWLPIYHMYAQGSPNLEAMVGLNMPGIYYSLRRMADADPEPTTGQNQSISVAYRIEAMPALAVPLQEGKVISQATENIRTAGAQ